MSTPEPILTKIKLLLNLAKSPNPNEAENAKSLADKLISKYNLSEEELKGLEDPKPLYGDDDKLFVTIGIVAWKQSLALTIAKQFYCKIIQEELVPIEGLSQYTCYVYGDKEDADNVRTVYYIFSDKIEKLVEQKCFGRGPVYTSSYTEGLVEAINNNIMWEGIDIPNIKKPSEELKEDAPSDSTSLAPVKKEEKENPCKETVSPVGKTFIKDVQAYFKGLSDGRDFSLQDVLELVVENQKMKELKVAEVEGFEPSEERLTPL